MSTLTPNRALQKAVDADDPEVYLTVNLAATLDNLDVHTHPASDVNSGVLDPSRLASGTPDNTKFVRGDGTWAVPPGGASVAAADVTNTPTGDIASSDVQSALNELDVEKAPVVHTHGASDVTSGTLGTARLGSGSASANTVLHGDSTWGAINASTQLGSGTVPTARLGSGSPTSSTPLWGDQSYRAITASDLSSGLIALARLGSGSDASGNNFLADDSTWKAVPQNLPTGGSTDQALVKTSGTDYAVGWANVLNASSHDLLDHSTAVGTAVINDLSDVTITGATDNDVLVSTALGWINDRSFIAPLRVYTASRFI